MLALQAQAGNKAVGAMLELQRDAGAAPVLHDLQSPRFAGDPILEDVYDGNRYVKRNAWGKSVSRGDAVRKIQEALIELGHPLPRYGADGSFGEETETALRAFQHNSGFSGDDVDGIVGPMTMESLDLRFRTGPGTTTEGGGTTGGPGGTTSGPGTTTGGPGTTTGGPGTTTGGGGVLTPNEQAKWILDTTFPAGSPWRNLNWAAVREGAKKRVDSPSDMNQKNLNVCGPATVAHMLLTADPVGYANLVIQVFSSATIQGTQMNEDLLNNAPPLDSAGVQMEQVDWMLLSAMRDSENWLMDYEGTPDEDFSAMTTPGEIADWMESLLGCVETESYTSYLPWEEATDDAVTVSELLSTYGDGVFVAMLVDSDRLEYSNEGMNVPTHWIRLMEPMHFYDAVITFKAYTWGDIKTFAAYRESDYIDFNDVAFEFVVGARRHGIALP